MEEITNKQLFEEIQVLKNTLSAMNNYYAEALSKTIITKNDIDDIKKFINTQIKRETKNGKRHKRKRSK